MNILLIFPHPDDAALNSAGTLARWVQEGHNVTAICVTRGNVGSLDLNQNEEDVGRIRSAELLAANKILGIEETVFLDFPDGCRMDPEKLREALFRCVRQYQPNRVLTTDPWVRYEVHRDHITVGQMASEAAAFACFHLLYPQQIQEGLSPHNASEVWYMGLLGQGPNTFVSIENQLGQKTEALLKFEATLGILDQLFCEDQQDSNEPSSAVLKQRAEAWIQKSASETGTMVGLNAAEAFIVLKCAPGHFDNVSDITRRLSQDLPPDPLIYN